MQSHFVTVAVTLLLTSLGLNVLADPNINLDYLTLGQRTFSADLYKAIAPTSEGNFAVSTTDVFFGLLRLYFGSENPSKRCLEYTLGIYNTEGYLSSSDEYALMMDNLQDDRSIELNFENGMAYRATYILKSDYEATIHDVFRQLGSSTRFIGIDDFLDTLHSWYFRKMLAPDFERNEFTGAENIILFGGGYLMQQWQQDDRCVYNSTYTSDAQTSKSDVAYTHLLGNFSYGELPDLSASYVAIPWSARPGDFILYLILPDSKDGLSKLEYGITHDTIEKMISEGKEREVHVSVPEIRLRSKLHLSSIIADKLFMYEVFDEGNFSSMAMPDPERVNSVLNVVDILAFDDDGPPCPANAPPNDEMHSDRPHFNANRPFLIVAVSKGEKADGKESVIICMARHKVPE